MARPFHVAPVLRPGKTILSATFRLASGERVTRSLGTADLDAAKFICAGLVRLHTSAVTSPNSVPPGVPPEATRIYFGMAPNGDDELPMDAADLPKLATFQADLKRFPKEARAAVLQLLIERHGLRQKASDGASKIQVLTNQLDDLQAEHDALKRSAIAQISASTARMSGLNEALEMYEKHLATRVTPGTKKNCVRFAKKFIEWLPKEVKTMAEVRPDHIGRFLDEETSHTPSSKPLARRRNLRIRLSNFINWSAKSYEYPSQMLAVKGIGKKQMRRERGEIVWHDLADVETVVEGLDAYWSALVATLAYAGLRLSELCWLRTSDVDFAKEQIWVGPVTDEAGGAHQLKTADSERHVRIHPRLLLPRLKAFKEAGHCGFYFFARPQTARKRNRTEKGHLERWRAENLSVALRGHAGGSDKRKRPPTPAKLPRGMSPATLRHTFGSLLIRSGKSYIEASASMGNSPTVCREFYARLKGSEVTVDF